MTDPQPVRGAVLDDDDLALPDRPVPIPDPALVPATGPPPSCADRSPHPPIRITEDHGPQGFTWTNPVTGEREPRPGSGVVGGSGTEADPFVIAGWCLVVPTDIAEAGVPDPVPALLIDGTDSHLVIRNNTVAGSQEEGAGLVLWLVENVRVEDNHLTSARVGAFVGHSTDVVFASNVAEGNRDGIYVWHSPNPVVEDNIVRNNTRYGIAATGLGARPVVGGNTAVNNSVGLEVKGYNAQVTGNVADGNRVDLRVSASSGTRVVDNRLGTGLVMLGFSPFDSGQEIRNNTVDGEPVVYIEGADAPEIPDQVGQLILANVTNATAQGLEIRDAAVGIQVAHGRNVEMRNNTIAGGQWGIRVDDSDDVQVRRNSVANSSQAGIEVDWSQPVSIANNTVTGSDVGVRVGGTLGQARAVVRDNMVTENRQGIHLGYAAQGVVVHNNSVRQNSEGIRVQDVDDGVLSHNTVAANDDGIRLRRARGTRIRNNSIVQNAGHGLVAENSPDRGPGTIELQRNNIEDNGIGLLADRSAVDSRWNWWGHPTGPSGGSWDPCAGTLATGQGDTISDLGSRVCFDPWRTQPNPNAGAG